MAIVDMDDWREADECDPFITYGCCNLLFILWLIAFFGTHAHMSKYDYQARSKPEHILCAAIWYMDEDNVELTHRCKNIDKGIVLTGYRHPHIINLYYQLTKKKTAGRRYTQGFLTSKNNFVDRREAYEIALRTHQIKNWLMAPLNSELFSEDLY